MAKMCPEYEALVINCAKQGILLTKKLVMESKIPQSLYLHYRGSDRQCSGELFLVNESHQYSQYPRVTNEFLSTTDSYESYYLWIYERGQTAQILSLFRWKREFPDFDIHDIDFDYEDIGFPYDVSLHQDLRPSFSASEHVFGEHFRLFVNRRSVNDRILISPRFEVVRCFENGLCGNVVFSCENVKDLAQWFQKVQMNGDRNPWQSGFNGVPNRCSAATMMHSAG